MKNFDKKFKEAYKKEYENIHPSEKVLSELAEKMSAAAIGGAAFGLPKLKVNPVDKVLNFVKIPAFYATAAATVVVVAAVAIAARQLNLFESDYKAPDPPATSVNQEAELPYGTLPELSAPQMTTIPGLIDETNDTTGIPPEQTGNNNDSDSPIYNPQNPQDLLPGGFPQLPTLNNAGDKDPSGDSPNPSGNGIRPSTSGESPKTISPDTPDASYPEVKPITTLPVPTTAKPPTTTKRPITQPPYTQPLPPTNPPLQTTVGIGTGEWTIVATTASPTTEAKMRGYEFAKAYIPIGMSQEEVCSLLENNGYTYSIYLNFIYFDNAILVMSSFSDTSASVASILKWFF